MDEDDEIRDAPRILVEGGPVHKHINTAIAAIVGTIIGLSGGLTFAIIRSFEASTDARHAVSRIDKSRADSIRVNCEDLNARHKTVKLGIEAIAAKTQPQNTTRATKLQQKIILELFVNAIAPKRNCTVVVRQNTGQNPR